MKITDPKQLGSWEKIIGHQNVKACKRALKDGCELWVFQSRNEVKRERALTREERDFCFGRFDSGESWAGIFRRPKPPCMPGIVPCSCHDVHGNPIGGSDEPPHGSIH